LKIKILFPAILIFLIACNNTYTPKPAGYPKIEFPEKAYKPYVSDAPYSFEIPVYSYVEDELKNNPEPWWINIVIPHFNSKIYISYKKVENNLDEYITDSRTLVYKHTSKSEGIEETPFMNDSARRYGIIYDLKGNVASAVQFFVTDSTDNFIRGSLYFNSRINRDSLNPIINFLREDIVHLIETTSWKY